MPEMVLNYYGVDWLAMALTFLSLYFLGKKKRCGFVFGLGANASWLAFGVMAGSIANPAANVVFAILNINGYCHWSRSRGRETEA